MVRKSLIVSPDCRRLAYVARKGKTQVAVVDRKEQRGYDKIENGSLTFSPDGHRLAYVARESQKQLVIVDGKEQKHHDKIEKGSLTFSPDGQHLAYAARESKKQLVIMDGKEQTQYERIAGGSLTFSPDGQHLAYVAQDSNKLFVIVDGQEEPQYEEEQEGSLDLVGVFLVFSPNSQRLAYEVHMEEPRDEGSGPAHGFVVVDGKQGRQYDRGIKIGSLAFSPDSRRVAYVAAERGQSLGSQHQEFVVVDGGEWKRYEPVEHWNLVFSPDSQRLAYFADMVVHVVDISGQELHAHGAYGQKPPVFSPDGQRLAYMYGWDIRVVDMNKPSVEHQAAHPTIEWPLVFSPDGRQVAYVARVEWSRKQFVVVDGQQHKPYDAVYERSLTFDPNSRWVTYVSAIFQRRLAFIKVGEKHMFVVDGDEGRQYDEIVAPPGGGSVFFSSPDHPHYIARKDSAFYLVEERLT